MAFIVRASDWSTPAVCLVRKWEGDQEETHIVTVGHSIRRGEQWTQEKLCYLLFAVATDFPFVPMGQRARVLLKSLCVGLHHSEPARSQDGNGPPVHTAYTTQISTHWPVTRHSRSLLEYEGAS